MAHGLAAQERLVLLCAHYEGVDERAIALAVTDEVSIGDYVLTGGELPAMVITDAVVRLLPGVIEAESLAEESFAAGLLEYPHYTRPPEFRGLHRPGHPDERQPRRESPAGGASRRSSAPAPAAPICLPMLRSPPPTTASLHTTR